MKRQTHWNLISILESFYEDFSNWLLWFYRLQFYQLFKKNNIDHIGVDSLESSSSKQLYKINDDKIYPNISI